MLAFITGSLIDSSLKITENKKNNMSDFHSRHFDLSGVTKNINNGFVPFECPSSDTCQRDTDAAKVTLYLIPVPTVTCQNVCCEKPFV